MGRTILMLEHDDDDRYITQAVFAEHQYDVKLQFVTNREEFFTALKNPAIHPSLILLNFHAGPSNAIEIIREVRKTERYKSTPVIVLSGSVKNEVISECYAAGANSFIQKPWSSKTTDEKVRNFFYYWFKTVELPSQQ
jgi:CheY-like chemotaxis protein